MDSELQNTDICRVCRSEGLTDRPLFHPCICTGSIKWIHQECLTQWMRYSRKEYCELCGHKFSFTPIYSPDMPRRLPVKDLAAGLLTSIMTAIKYWLHYTLVAVAWLGVVPLSACRIYRALFSCTVESILSLPYEMFSRDNIAADVLQGCFVVSCTLFAFAGLVWLREQIVHGGGPEWLQDNAQVEEGVADIPGPAPLNNNIPEEPEEEENVVPAPAPEPPVNEVPQPQENPVELNDELNGEDNNWIPMEWDRAAEEITWERLLGLDGSLKFLEHVFWVISLNTLFIMIFAFSPFHVGKMTLAVFNMKEYASASHFEGLLTSLVGYCTVGMSFVIFHKLCELLGFHRAKRYLGLCYVVVKVSMLSVVEIGILPLVCGWWLDICSLAMFDATLKDREASFVAAPGTSIFIHWLIGMVYVYYFASFILLLREILRPGVIWFLRNFNDPDFNPIQEMIQLAILEHIRKLLISAVIFGTVVLLMLWLPIRILKTVLPSFLPYTVSLNSETQMNELSLELLLLQVILPALLEQSHTRIWLKSMVRNWCRVVAWILNIHSYLLGDTDVHENQDERQENEANQQDLNGGLGAAHQAMLMMEPPVGFQPYTKPSFFIARLVGLLVSICFSLVMCSVIALTLPVWLGRRVMAIWLTASSTAPVPATTPMITPNNITALTTTKGALSTTMPSDIKIHELYTAACGLYMCWLAARTISLVLSWLPQGRAAMMDRLKQWCLLGIKTIVASVLLLGVIPLLFGLLLDMVVIIPLRVPIYQTPILFVWQDWALGVLYTKIACAVTMMGPEWFLRAAIERAYRDGIREMHLSMIIRDLAGPVIVTFGLALSIPYILASSIFPLFVSSLPLQNIIVRRIYPFLLLMCVVCVAIALQIRQFRKLYEHIKNDKYLVGQRLVNYDHNKKSKAATN